MFNGLTHKITGEFRLTLDLAIDRTVSTLVSVSLNENNYFSFWLTFGDYTVKPILFACLPFIS